MKIPTHANLPAVPVQPDLFNLPPRVRIGARDTDTSKAAAVKVARTIGERLNVVLQAIRAAGAHGMTADEIADQLGLKPTQVRPRCSDLCNEHRLIRDSGVRRPNADGNDMIVWISVEVVVPRNAGEVAA